MQNKYYIDGGQNYDYEQSSINFINRTLLNMGLGLLITAIVAFLSIFLVVNVGFNPIVYYAAIIGEFALVMYLSKRVNKMSLGMARAMFFLYAAVNGFTLSIVFLSYGIGLVFTAFVITALMFFCSAMVGFTIKKDLSVMQRFLLMALIGIILINIISFILPMFGLGGWFSGFNIVIAYVGVAIFCGLTAYDMQRIKLFHRECYQIEEETANKYAIMSALSLYLDFINILLFVLRILGSRGRSRD